MAKVNFNGDLPVPKEDNRLNQGDFVYCKGAGGTGNFWGIVNTSIGVISIDGASDKYVRGKDLYLGEKYSYWTIVKRVPCEKMKVTLEEIQ